VLSDERKHFLKYLNDWYYKELSSADHLSFPGLILRGAPLGPHDDDSDAKLDMLRSHFFESTISLAMAILSEIQIEGRFRHAAQLKYVWRVLTDMDNPKELYELRYSNRL
jgi:hypothetical protein